MEIKNICCCLRKRKGNLELWDTFYYLIVFLALDFALRFFSFPSFLCFLFFLLEQMLGLLLFELVFGILAKTTVLAFLPKLESSVSTAHDCSVLNA